MAAEASQIRNHGIDDRPSSAPAGIDPINVFLQSVTKKYFTEKAADSISSSTSKTEAKENEHKQGVTTSTRIAATLEELAYLSYLTGSIQVTQLDSGAPPKYAGNIPGVPTHKDFRKAAKLAFHTLIKNIEAKEFKEGESEASNISLGGNVVDANRADSRETVIDEDEGTDESNQADPFYDDLHFILQEKYHTTRTEETKNNPPLRTYQFLLKDGKLVIEPMWEDILSDQLDIAYAATKELGANTETLAKIKAHIHQRILNRIDSYTEAKQIAENLHGYMLWAIPNQNLEKTKADYERALQTVSAGPRDCDIAIFNQATGEVYFHQRHFALTDEQQLARNAATDNNGEKTASDTTSTTPATNPAKDDVDIKESPAAVMPTSHNRNGKTSGIPNLRQVLVYAKDNHFHWELTRVEYAHASLVPYKLSDQFRRDQETRANLKQLIDVVNDKPFVERPPTEDTGGAGAGAGSTPPGTPSTTASQNTDDSEIPENKGIHITVQRPRPNRGLANFSLLTVTQSSLMNKLLGETEQFYSTFLAFYGLEEGNLNDRLFFNFPLNRTGRNQSFTHPLQDHINRVGFLRLARNVIEDCGLNSPGTKYNTLLTKINKFLTNHDADLQEKAKAYFSATSQHTAKRAEALTAYQQYESKSRRLRNEVLELFLDHPQLAPTSTQDQKETLSLFRYCLALYDPTYNLWKDTQYAGRLPAALSVLAEKLNYTVTYNCKSGNDRTHEMARLRAEFHLNEALAITEKHIRVLSLNGINTLSFMLIPLMFAGAFAFLEFRPELHKGLLGEPAFTHTAIALFLSIYIILQIIRLDRSIRGARARNNTATKTSHALQATAATLSILGGASIMIFTFKGNFLRCLSTLFPASCFILALAIQLGLGIYKSVQTCEDKKKTTCQKINAAILNTAPPAIALGVMVSCFLPFPLIAKLTSFEHILPHYHMKLFSAHAIYLIAPASILLTILAIWHYCSKPTPAGKSLHSTHIRTNSSNDRSLNPI